MDKKIEGVTSDQMHNLNCFRYFKALKLPSDATRFATFIQKFGQEFQPILQKISNIQKSEYNSKVAYGDWFTDFFKELEVGHSAIQKIREEFCIMIGLDDIALSDKYKDKKLEQNNLDDIKEKTTLTEEIQEQRDELDEFINSIYDNENLNIEKTYEAIKHIPQNQDPSKRATKKQIATFLSDQWITTNRKTPAQTDTRWSRFITTMSSHFTPQYFTNLPSILNYSYQKTPKQFRFGTQAQRINNQARVSPAYELWLQNRKDMKKGLLLYINNLGLDRLDIEGNKEFELTKALHTLENRHHNIAVITLPADKGLMTEHHFQETSPTNETYEHVLNKFMDITKGSSLDNPNSKAVKDFYISPKIKAKLFTDGRSEEAVYKELLESSFEELNLKKDNLSKAEQQAVWIHFIKFKLTDMIITKLKPQALHFSCKDAIDRGSISSAYYNLMKSLSLGTPISREEFDRVLHTPAAMVKGRGMNNHSNRIWNVVDAYVSANASALTKDATWLIEWRDVNCPPARVNELLKRRIEELVTNTPKTSSEVNTENAPLKARNIYEYIKEMSEKNIGNKKLLLTIMAITLTLDKDPSNKEAQKRYSELAKQLPNYSAVFTQLAGYMYLFLAAITESVNPKMANKYYAIGKNFLREASLAGDLRQEMNKKQDISSDEPPLPR
ncbi:MAG: hypothetical protein Q8R83_08810 [Legionellaceae bacterium]|nr:hypothetical protein [Legionellaceae bacterium]